MKQSGWFKESARHSLAAKGVPTGRKMRLAPKVVSKSLLPDSDLKRVQKYLFSLEETIGDQYSLEGLGYEGKTRDAVDKMSAKFRGEPVGELSRNELALIQKYLFNVEEATQDEGWNVDALGYSGKTVDSIDKLNEILSIDYKK